MDAQTAEAELLKHRKPVVIEIMGGGGACLNVQQAVETIKAGQQVSAAIKTHAARWERFKERWQGKERTMSKLGEKMSELAIAMNRWEMAAAGLDYTDPIVCEWYERVTTRIEGGERRILVEIRISLIDSYRRVKVDERQYRLAYNRSKYGRHDNRGAQ